MEHTTSVQVGEAYDFRGLRGQEEKLEDRVRLVVQRITVSGTLVLDVESTFHGAPPIVQLPYSEALLLIRQGIWEPADRA